MSPAEIKIEIYWRKLKKETSIKAIADGLGCSPQAVHYVIERRSVSKRIMVAVSKAIGLPKETVFSEYFQESN